MTGHKTRVNDLQKRWVGWIAGCLVGLGMAGLAGRTRRRELVEPQATVFGAHGLFCGQVLIGGNLFGQLMLLNATCVARGLSGSLGVQANRLLKVFGHSFDAKKSDGLRLDVGNYLLTTRL